MEENKEKHLKDLIFIEKFRPNSLETLIFEKKNELKTFLLSPLNLPSFLFVSKSPGTGKTSTAKIISNILGCDTLLINSSDERGIDTIREKIKLFAQSLSMTSGAKRLIFLDEADGLCLNENTLIKIFKNNTIQNIKIKDLIGEEFSVLSLNNFKKFEVSKAVVVQNSDKEMYEIELENGEKIICSEEHPFFQSKNNSLKLYPIKCKELQIGDSILALPTIINNLNYSTYCRICGQFFIKKWNLSFHIKIKHKNITLEQYFCKYIGIKKKCKNCGKNTQFKGLVYGYAATCSATCKASMAGKISFIKTKNYLFMKGKWKNISQGRKYEDIYGEEKAKIMKLKSSLSHKKFYSSKKGKHIIKKTAKQNSILLKERIKKGIFTPNVTNRWTHRTAKITINNKHYSFRSSWEVKFFEYLIKKGLREKEILYETIRIPYVTKNKKIRIYIVDFYIPKFNLLIEIKPKCFIKKDKYKINAAIEYCRDRNLHFMLLTEQELITMGILNE